VPTGDDTRCHIALPFTGKTAQLSTSQMHRLGKDMNSHAPFRFSEKVTFASRAKFVHQSARPFQIDCNIKHPQCSGGGAGARNRLAKREKLNSNVSRPTHNAGHYSRLQNSNAAIFGKVI
jgi:hypothetical protein